MAERVMFPDTYRSRVILGKEGGNTVKVAMVEKVAKTLLDYGVLDPKVDKSWAGNNCKKVFRDLLGFEADGISVGDLMETVGDRNKSERQKEKAEEGLWILGTSVYLVMRYGGIEGAQDVLGRGSVSEIDTFLPENLAGLAYRVRSCIFDEEGPVVKCLDDLDEVRVATKQLPEDVGRKKLSAGLDESIDQLLKMKLGREHGGERNMALAYLGQEAEKLGEGVGPSTVVEKTAKVVQSSSRGEYDGKTYGSPEGMERIAPIRLTDEDIQELVEVQSDDDMRGWMARAFVRISENPLFFANWWQQSVVENVVRTAQTKLNYGDYSKEHNNLRDYGYALISVLGMQEVDRNADANSDNYGQFAPPKNMAYALHWDDGGKKYDLLRGDPQIDVLFRKIFTNAFDNESGWKVVMAFSSTDNLTRQNEYLNTLIEDEGTKKAFKDAGVKITGVDHDLLLAKGRVAMAMFEVDWMPEWIRTMNERKRNFAEGVDKARDVPWLQAFNDEYFESFSGDKSEKNKQKAVGLRSYDTFAYAGTMLAKVPGVNGDKEFKLGYDHPRVMRIWDVAAGAKGSYKHRPEVIWRMENVLKPFYAERIEKDGRWLRLSVTNATDRYLKLGKAMFEIVGGPQAAEWDNITNFDKILPTVANFWTGEAHGNPAFGNFMADLFAAKTDAMFFPGYPHNGDLTFDRIAALDPYSGEKEKQLALEGILGPKGSAAHGFVAEMKRLYEIDLLGVHNEGKETVADYPQFYDAYIRVFMDEPDRGKAWVLYNKSVRELNRKKRVAIAGGVMGVARSVLKMK